MFTPIKLGNFSTLAFSPSIQIGSKGINVGINSTLGSNIGKLNLQLNAGFSMGTMSGTGQEGIKGRISAMIVRPPKGLVLSLASNQFISGETSQRTAAISLGYKKVSVIY